MALHYRTIFNEKYYATDRVKETKAEAHIFVNNVVITFWLPQALFR